MKTFLSALLTIALTAAFWDGTLVLGGGTGSPFPDLKCPGVPDKGKCCIGHVHLRGVGELSNRIVTLDTPYECRLDDKLFKTARSKTFSMHLVFTGGGDCDESKTVIPAKSTMDIRGNYIHRSDGLAHFSGVFVMRDPNKGLLFEGCIETMDRVGSHSAPIGTEPCAPANRFEGWLVGRGNPKDATRARFSLRAMLVAESKFDATGTSKFMPKVGLNGVLVHCP